MDGRVKPGHDAECEAASAAKAGPNEIRHLRPHRRRGRAARPALRRPADHRRGLRPRGLLRVRGRAKDAVRRRLRRPRAPRRGRQRPRPARPRVRQAAAFGAVQRRGTHDWILARAGRAAAARPDGVRAALHLGLEQLLFHATASPTHAAVAESSSSPSRARGTGWSTRSCAAASARASARRATRPGRRARSATRTPMDRRACGGTGSGPSATRALLVADNEPAELALRVNTLVDRPEALARRRSADAAHERRGRSSSMGRSTRFAPPGFEAGAFMPQSRAAQRVARLARAAARRARARPVRRARRQDDASRGADGGPRRGRRRRAPRRARRGAASARARGCARDRARGRPRRQALEDEAGFDRVLCSTRRAAASARCSVGPRPALARARERRRRRLRRSRTRCSMRAARRCCGPAGGSCSPSARSRRAKSACRARDFLAHVPSEDGTDGF